MSSVFPHNLLTLHLLEIILREFLSHESLHSTVFGHVVIVPVIIVTQPLMINVSNMKPFHGVFLGACVFYCLIVSSSATFSTLSQLFSGRQFANQVSQNQLTNANLIGGNQVPQNQMGSANLVGGGGGIATGGQMGARFVNQQQSGGLLGGGGGGLANLIGGGGGGGGGGSGASGNLLGNILPPGMTMTQDGCLCPVPKAKTRYIAVEVPKVVFIPPKEKTKIITVKEVDEYPSYPKEYSKEYVKEYEEDEKYEDSKNRESVAFD